MPGWGSTATVEDQIQSALKPITHKDCQLGITKIYRSWEVSLSFLFRDISNRFHGAFCYNG